LFLLKQYADQRSQGKYVWLNSASTKNPRIFHNIYIGSKVASKFSIDLISQEINHIKVLEASIGLTRSNIRYRNFSGTKTMEQVQDTYGDEHVLECDYVAEQIFSAIKKDLTQTEIT
jgi:NADP-dependent 3-hydroxy acid dehydrogenase YdfG